MGEGETGQVDWGKGVRCKLSSPQKLLLDLRYETLLIHSMDINIIIARFKYTKFDFYRPSLPSTWPSRAEDFDDLWLNVSLGIK